MTVNTTNITSGPYTGNGTADTFAYTFRIEDDSQLTVFQTDTSGTVTTLTLTTDYTVTGEGNDGGGNVVLNSPLPTDYTLYIRSNYQNTQETDFESQGAFYPSVHEAALDKQTFLIQQHEDLIERSLRFPASYSGGADAELPTPEADKYLRWNAAGDALTNAAGTGAANLGDDQTWTGINTFEGPVKLGDASDTHHYTLGVGELAADRTVSLPVLTADATFAVLEKAQTFTQQQTFSAGLKTDTISEKTAAAGVTIDGVLLKDGGISFGATWSISAAGAAQFASIDNTPIGQSTKAAVGATALTVTGGIASITASTGQVGAQSNRGLEMAGNGAVNDVTIQNKNEVDVLSIPTGTTDVKVNAGSVILGTSGESFQLSDGSTINETRATIPGFLNIGPAASATISGGVVTATKTRMALAGEGGAADSLDTINGSFEDGDIVVLLSQTSTYTITINDGAGNISLPANFDLTHVDDRLILEYRAASGRFVQWAGSSNA